MSSTRRRSHAVAVAAAELAHPVLLGETGRTRSRTSRPTRRGYATAGALRECGARRRERGAFCRARFLRKGRAGCGGDRHRPPRRWPPRARAGFDGPTTKFPKVYFGFEALERGAATRVIGARREIGELSSGMLEEDVDAVVRPNGMTVRHVRHIPTSADRDAETPSVSEVATRTISSGLPTLQAICTLHPV